MHAINFLWTINEVVQNKTETLDTEKTIGRNADNTFQILDPQVSGRQALVRSDGAQVVIRNVSETNNIQVDQTIVDKNGGSATLNDQALVLMGTTTLETRIVFFENDVVLDASCTNCSRPIPSGTVVCPWCGATQSQGDRITMV